jgi:hypothetical protein
MAAAGQQQAYQHQMPFQQQQQGVPGPAFTQQVQQPLQPAVTPVPTAPPQALQQQQQQQLAQSQPPPAGVTAADGGKVYKVQGKIEKVVEEDQERGTRRHRGHRRDTYSSDDGYYDDDRYEMYITHSRCCALLCI